MNNGSRPASTSRAATTGGTPPDETRDEDLAVNRFEEANSRRSTPAERRLLRTMADQFGGERGLAHGWRLLTAAVDDAVAAGSAYVAPRRLREILTRWAKDGVPADYADLLGETGRAPGRAAASSRPEVSGATHGRHAEARPIRQAEARGAEASPREAPSGRTVAIPAELPEPPSFTIAECGLTNRQVWSAVLDTLRASGEISRSNIDTWLRDAAIVGRGEDGAMIVGAPHALAQRRLAGGFKAPLRRALAAVTGASLPVEVVLTRDWLAPDDSPTTRRTS